jgi:MerR family transcriptional regulator, light-induced transcriptional regulator
MSDQPALMNRALDGEGRNWADALNAFGAEAGTLKDSQIMDLLAHVVEGEIIPRLMLAHQQYSTSNKSHERSNPMSPEAIDRFAQLTITGEVDDLEDQIVDLTRQGIVTEAVYLDLMAPAARRLGDYWDQDLCSFTDVTIGLGRLQTLLYRLSAKHKGVEDRDALVTTGLFITPSGAQHSFGIRMVEDLFRRAGWKTLCIPDISIPELKATLAAQSFDLLGLGISVADQFDLAQDMISLARSSSCNPEVKIMVGGALIVENPQHARALGADFSAVDAREAVTIAQNIIYDLKMRH